MEKTNKRRLAAVVLWGMATLACMIIIFCMSHKPGDESAEMSGVIVRWLLSLGMGEGLAENLDFAVRKCAHMAEFGGLALCVSFLFIYIKGNVVIKVRLRAVLFAFLYAVSDEIHQLFVAGRAGKVSDVVIDSVGIGVAFVIVTFLKKYCFTSIYSPKRVEKG